MASHKEKSQFAAEQETLLIPLYAKAVESRRSRPIFVDSKAQEILEQIDYDFAKLKVPGKTVLMVCLRAKKMDGYTKAFLARHPRSVVIQLGCGLDSRYVRVEHRQAEWFDLDMPAVIDLRRKFYAETDRYHMIASSVTDLRWMECIAPRGRPVLVIAEGLLMYLEEDDVKALILRLKETFPGCELVFDAFSVLTAKNVKQHPSLKGTGAEVHWGIDNAADIEQWATGIRLQEEWYFTQAADIAKLGFGYRLAFALAGLFAAAKKAHRILYYRCE